MARRMYIRMEAEVIVETDQAAHALIETFNSCKEALEEQSKVEGRIVNLMYLEPNLNQFKASLK